MLVHGDLRTGGESTPPVKIFVGMEETIRVIVDAITDEFVGSTDHGLDGYVSLRIRHGTLGNEIRAPFETQHLITTLDNAGKYVPNAYWTERIDDEKLPAVRKALAALSAEVDAIVGELKREWLQVRRAPTGHGMFDFALTDRELASIREQLGRDTKLNELITIVLQELFRMLEDSLANIRRRIREEAKARAMRALDDVEAAVGAWYPGAVELRTAINVARTDVQRTFDRVVEWFRVSESAPTEPFTADEAVSIALEVLHLSQSLEVQTEGVPDVLLRGDRFNAFVDIFIIAFQNIAAHAKLEKPRARVEFEADDVALSIRVANPVAEGVASTENRRRLVAIQERLNSGTSAPEVAREGGTGFIKLAKIFSHDLRIKTPVVNFGFAGGSFVVDLVLPWEACIHAHTDRG